MPGKVKIGLVQTTCTNNVNSNIEKAIAGIKTASAKGANIVCLQELFTSLYFCDTQDQIKFNLAEPIPGSTTIQLQAVAKECGVVIVASLFEKRAPGLHHNTTAVIGSDGSFLGIYRKSHIPDDPGFNEKFYFAPGDTGYKVFDTAFGRIGVLICWDQWYPEAARITSLMGAEILFYPTAIGWELDTSEEVNNEQYQAWQTIQRSHAIANGVHVVAVNRVGIEGISKFWGGSFVSNPFGTVIYQASHNNEEIYVQEIDLSKNAYYRSIWPFLRDRRIDSYEPILKRFID